MNFINVNQVTDGMSMTDDSYILDDLFFLPKNLPVKPCHISILRKWNIDRIGSEGRPTNISMDKIVEDKPTVKEVDKVIEKDFPEQNKDGAEDQDEIKIEVKRDPVGSALLDSSVKDLLEQYKQWIKKIVNIFNEIIVKQTVDKEAVKDFISEIINTINKNKSNALMLLGKKIEGVLFVYPQTIETIILTYIIGDSMKLSDLAISNLATATLFHDIGMLKVPRSVLEKKEALSPDELKVIRSHPTVGYQILRDLKYSAIIASGAYQHHERMDARGYPNGLTPDKITEISKIISVADAYCAAIATKPFKTSPQHAKEVIQDLLRGGGTKYDPAILKELIKNISFYPIGSLVLLSNAKPARVVGTSGVAMKPIVRIIVNGREADIVDLSKNSALYIKGLYSSQSPF